MEYSKKDLVMYDDKDWFVNAVFDDGTYGIMRFDGSLEKSIGKINIRAEELEPILDENGNVKRFTIGKTAAPGYTPK